jgi:hypothetical protein
MVNGVDAVKKRMDKRVNWIERETMLKMNE